MKIKRAAKKTSKKKWQEDAQKKRGEKRKWMRINILFVSNISVYLIKFKNNK